MATNLDSLRMENGKLPAFAWPGGYQLAYLFADGETCCPDCANGMNGSLATTAAEADDQWRIIGADVHWEGPNLYCGHCDEAIPSAYGDPDAEDA